MGVQLKHLGLVVPLLFGASPQAMAAATEFYFGHEVVSGEVLVKFKPDISGAAIRDVKAKHNIDTEEGLGSTKVRRMHSRTQDIASMIAQLKNRSDVEFVEPNYIVHTSAVPNDPSFATDMWGLRNTGQTIGGVTGTVGADIKATTAWDVSVGNRNQVIAVIDTGTDYNHPDLQANIWSAPSAFTVQVSDGTSTTTVTCAAGTHGFNAITNVCDPMDDQGHGTHVAGTIGAVGNNLTGVVGVNHQASIMPLKFLDATGNGSTANAVKAIDFAIQAKTQLGTAANVRVLSNSWGGPGFSQALLDVIIKANAEGMLFVAAAGNAATNTDSTPNYPSGYDAPNVISVAATTNVDGLWVDSNYGATTVDLGAPGHLIYSTIRNGSYSSVSGTSMATPHVAGAAALLLSKCTLDTASLKATLLNNVDVIASLQGKTVTGGRLNVDKAIRACAGAVVAPTLSFTASPTSVVSGGSSTLTWNSTNATSCTASGGWSGTLATSGSQIKTLTSTTTYSLSCTGPGGTTPTQSVTVSVVPGTAPTVTLSASPTTIVAGNASTLTWSSTNATSCSASATGGASWWTAPSLATSGSTQVWPPSNSVYTVSCTGPGGTGSKSVAITVTPSTLPTVTVTASPSTIALGSSTVVSWSATNATSCTASGGWSGTTSVMAGSITTAPAVTTTYYMSCTGTGGTANGSATVTVNAALPAITLTANPTSITAGQTSTISWAVSNATTCTASGAWSGTVTAMTGSAVVAPLSTSTYYFTCTGAGGSSVGSVTVTVAAAPLPVVTISAKSTSITAGQSSTITWNVTNATTCTGSGGWGGSGFGTSGSLSVAPVVTTTYTLSCTGTGGTGNGSATVTVTASAKPDLTGASFSGTLPANANIGTSFNVDNGVTNLTSVVTGAGTVGVYLSTDATITTADRLIGSWTFSSVGANTTLRNLTRVTIDPTTAPGTYYVGIYVDSGNVLAETNETNNAKTMSGTVKVVRSVDMIVTSVSAPTSVTRGTTFSVPVTIKNQGTTQTSIYPIYINVYLSTDTTITTSDTLLGQMSLASYLAAGASANGTLSTYVPTSMSARTYYIGAIVDPTNVQAETNETNNAKVGNSIAVK